MHPGVVATTIIEIQHIGGRVAQDPATDLLTINGGFYDVHRDRPLPRDCLRLATLANPFGQNPLSRHHGGCPAWTGQTRPLDYLSTAETKCVAATVQRCIRWGDEKGPRAGPFSFGGQPGCGWLASDLGER
jgi:hypothetical protein